MLVLVLMVAARITQFVLQHHASPRSVAYFVAADLAIFVVIVIAKEINISRTKRNTRQ